MSDTNNESSARDAGVATSSVFLYHEESTPPFLPVLAILPFLLPVFWKYHVTVTQDKELSFGYSWASVNKILITTDMVGKATPLEEVHALKHWGGWGIRKNLKWDTGYIARNGPGVKIQVGTKEKSHTYVFNCQEPEKLCSILNGQ
uniref:Uncharacterized protein n=1 Tax=Grammatophora oceanica TaxID=210454 RepID=A0A7S1VVB9_9STRA|mmetsp:Transcript_9100/g.13280  ORF Transcript_9100/g.13280 Transcript_9100/m.13280 type:complete len:146 (+) Transcript_9100:119-556(+)|eukprot:CAMPEP_0194027188 /NCGR_PEP_ID=MMETSP0009_2-20130614/1377_1 /TAXON_ID=210454 /ORGANISM="Grammatophora oceanica, Strain CCMP 410" /LENGTH=145 /DNA_ID=CAMNT_0038666155 /DNA_START=119 /DNA_END=556 /DNA_ORIENTATION=+